MSADPPRERPPSIHALLSHEAASTLVASFGREPVRDALRAEAALESARLRDGARAPTEPNKLIAAARERVLAERAPVLRPVLNLTGTVLHTNLGRAPLPEDALDAVRRVSIGASNLEYDLTEGRRGDRDAHVEDWLVRLTGAEAATVVNNNAAAVLLVLNTLARRKEVVISRGELVEIGSSFRLPDVMGAAGARLREVGATNRTRGRDYEDAMGPRTGALMRVHQSNYRIEGFCEAARDEELAAVAARHGSPFIIDLGAGSLIDLRRFGLPHEPTPREAIGAGADLVTFSGDKLLGGPQAGIIAGRRDLIARIRKNPLKRALRCDKMTIAALAAILPLYDAPESLARRLPALRLLTRDAKGLEALAAELAPALSDALARTARVTIVCCKSQIGSGAMPSDLLPSVALRITPARHSTSESRIAALLRALPVPIIGRLEKGAVLLDLRCLEERETFLAQMSPLRALAAGLPS